MASASSAEAAVSTSKPHSRTSRARPLRSSASSSTTSTVFPMVISSPHRDPSHDAWCASPGLLPPCSVASGEPRPSGPRLPDDAGQPPPTVQTFPDSGRLAPGDRSAPTSARAGAADTHPVVGDPAVGAAGHDPGAGHIEDAGHPAPAGDPAQDLGGGVGAG